MCRKATDLQSAAVTNAAHSPYTISFVVALFARSQRNWWPHYRLLIKLLRVDVYPMAYDNKTNGTAYG